MLWPHAAPLPAHIAALQKLGSNRLIGRTNKPKHKWLFIWPKSARLASCIVASRRRISLGLRPHHREAGSWPQPDLSDLIDLCGRGLKAFWPARHLRSAMAAAQSWRRIGAWRRRCRISGVANHCWPIICCAMAYQLVFSWLSAIGLVQLSMALARLRRRNRNKYCLRYPVYLALCAMSA